MHFHGKELATENALFFKIGLKIKTRAKEGSEWVKIGYRALNTDTAHRIKTFSSSFLDSTYCQLLPVTTSSSQWQFKELRTRQPAES